MPGSPALSGKAFVILQAIDKTGQVLAAAHKRIAAWAARTQMLIRGAFAARRIGQKFTRAIQQRLRALARMSTTIANKFQNAALMLGNLNRTGDAFNSIGRRMVLTAVAITAAMGWAGKTYANFDDTIRKVMVRSSGTEAEYLKLRDTAKELGATTSFTNSEVAQLMSTLARRGWDRNEIDAMTASILDLAKAAGEGESAMEDATLAADITSGLLQAYRMKASDAAQVTDLVTATVNNAATSMRELQDGLKFVASLSYAAEIPMRDMLETLGNLSNAWIRGTQGGTTYRRVMTELTRKSEDLLGVAIQVEKAGGGFRTLDEVIMDVKKATEGMSALQRFKVMEELFGIRGITGATALGERSQELADALDNAAGSTARVAKEMESGLGGAARRALSVFEALRTSIGEALSASFIEMLDTLRIVLAHFNEWVQNNAELIPQIITIVGKMAALGATFIAAGPALSLVAMSLNVVATTLAGMAALLPALLSPIGALIASFVALGYYTSRYTEEGMATVDRLKNSWNRAFTDMGRTLDTLKGALGAFWEALRTGQMDNALSILKKSFELAWVTVKVTFTRIWDSIIRYLHETFLNVMQGIDDTIVSMYKTASMIPGAQLGTYLGKKAFDSLMSGNREYRQKIRDRYAREDRQAELSGEDYAIRKLRQELEALSQATRESAKEIDKERMAREMAEKFLGKARTTAEGLWKNYAIPALWPEPAAAASGGSTGGGGPIPSQVIQGLQRGTVEAFRKSVENDNKPILDAIKKNTKDSASALEDIKRDINPTRSI